MEDAADLIELWQDHNADAEQAPSTEDAGIDDQNGRQQMPAGSRVGTRACLGLPCHAALREACTASCEAPKLVHWPVFGEVVVHTFKIPSGPAGQQVGRRLATLQQLRHPSVLQLLRYSCDENTRRIHTVTPCKAQGSLRSVLRWRHNQGIPLAAPALALLAQVAQGLHHMHASGVVHGGVSASNVLLSSDGNAFLACLTAMSISPEGAPTFEDDIHAFGCMAAEVATGQQVHPQILGDRRLFDRALPAPQGVRDLIWRCLLFEAQLRPTADALQQALSLHAAGSQGQVASILRGVLPVANRRGADVPRWPPRAHMTQPDIQQLDVQRAAWLAARMLAEAADARTPEARGAAVPTESLIAGLGLAYMQLQQLQGGRAKGFGFAISRGSARSSGGGMCCSLPSLFKADAILDCPGLQRGEAVACVFSLEGELLPAFAGTRSSVQLMRALRLVGSESTPLMGCRLVGCLEAAPGFRLRSCSIMASGQHNALLYGRAVLPSSLLGCTPIDARQPVPGGLLQGGLTCPPEFGAVYAELARCLQRHDGILNTADPPLQPLPRHRQL